MISVPALGNTSLFTQFTTSIGQNLEHFPVGPKLTDPFWHAPAGCTTEPVLGLAPGP